MAVNRPNVLVYQEYSSLSIVAATPEMEVIVVGPCFQLLDYLDDKDACYAAEYGTDPEEIVSPSVTPVAVVIATPPGMKAGGILQESSVKIYLDVARVRVTDADDDAAGPVNDPIFVANDSYFDAYVVNGGGGYDFVANGVVAGDILVAKTGATTKHVSTVKAVRSLLINTAGTGYNFLDGGGGYSALQAGDKVILSGDTALNDKRDGTYIVKKVRNNSTLEFENTGWKRKSYDDVTDPNPANNITIKMDVFSSANVRRDGYPILLAVLSNETCLRVANDFTVPSSGALDLAWRVEREVSDIEVSATDFDVVGNAVTVNSGITVDLSTATIDQNKLVTYGKIYMEYSALRTDLQRATSYSSTAEILEDLGKYDARNPLVVGAIVAKSNTSTSIKVYGIADIEQESLGYQKFLDDVSSIREIYSIVPLTTDASVLASIKASCESLASPSYALTKGIRQKFRVCLGSIIKPDTSTVAPESALASTSVGGATPGFTRTLTLTGTAVVPTDFAGFATPANAVLPGDTVVVTVSAVETRYKVAQVLSATSLEIDASGTTTTVIDVTLSDVNSGKIKVLVQDTATVRVAEFPATALKTVIITGSALAKPYITLTDSNADFSNVAAGDTLQMPVNPNAGDFTGTLTTWLVASVESDTRLLVEDKGKNTATLVNELPHGILRDSSGDAALNGQMYYRVIRYMTKDQQVDSMIAVALSFKSKRTILCYPDEVTVTDLVDGSLDRLDPDIAEEADPQPGYYLAAAVGGQTAGQPTQQGFTNLGIAGIKEIAGSNGYFTEEQLTELSNGGIYVFVQDTPESLPYSIHEVTTDVSALEFSEYMVTKNFDYVSLTFLDTLLPFIGTWNVLPSTIENIRQALRSSGDSLKKRYVVKIGAPLISYEISRIEVASESADRIEAYVNVELPMTLNVIGLHLVS